MGDCQTGYAAAAAAIRAGTAASQSLWVILTDEHQRDGYALRPMPWEGPGEYQRATYADGRDGFVRLGRDGRSLPSDVEPRAA